MRVDRHWLSEILRSLALVGCFLLIGCSSGEKPVKLHTVAGKLTITGAATPNIVIHFLPAKGRSSTGVTDAKGAFEMRYDSEHAGAIPGVHQVWIEYRPASPAEEMAVREGTSPLSNELQAALQKYGSMSSPQYQVTVDKDEKSLSINLQ